MKTQRLSKGARSCDGLRPKGQGMEKSGLNNRLETRAGKGTLNAGRTLWLAQNKGFSELTQIKFTLRAKCITKIRYLAARPLNVDEIKGEILLGARWEGRVPPVNLRVPTANKEPHAAPSGSQQTLSQVRFPTLRAISRKSRPFADLDVGDA